MCLKWFLIAFVGSVALTLGCRSRPIVKSPSGIIEGTSESCGKFCSYHSFKGIPYAQPVGELRFRNPVPHPGWRGTRDGSRHGDRCLQDSTGKLSGSEDCLFLNVYTQTLSGARPVMVWIHGGSYSASSGNAEEFGPEFLVEKDVVLVTINYRLGALGFLSTGDRNAQGNWGMKDCILALKWVRDNIAAFGGDSSSVTIFGNSAGASLVHLLVLSDAADGLFHKAISQAATALVPFALQPNPEFYAKRMATQLGLTSETSEFVDQLRSLPAETFVPLQESFERIPVPRFLRALDFGPVVEPEDAPEERALKKLPIDLITDHGHKVPFIIGYSNLEGALFTALENAIDSTAKDQFNAKPELLVPFFWKIEEGSEEAGKVSKAFQDFYWQGRPLDSSLEYEWALYQTDHEFLFSMDQTVRLHVEASSHPLFYYQLSHDGDLNIAKKMNNINLPGAVHADELAYLFNYNGSWQTLEDTESHSITVSRRMVHMWTNFARTADPTPRAESLLQNIRWLPVKSSQEYLDIGDDLVPSEWPNNARFSLWYELQQKYANDPYKYRMDAACSALTEDSQ